MILYGTKRKALNQQSAGIVQCPHCLQAAQVTAAVCGNYVHIYWIPLFGWKSPLYFCSTCQNSLLPRGAARYGKDLVVPIPPEARAAYLTLTSQVGIPWYYFTGTVLLIIAAVYILATQVK